VLSVARGAYGVSALLESFDMNRSYRVVWSEVRRAWIVAHEKAAFGGRPVLSAVAVAASLLAGASALAQPAATALPAGGTVTAGSAVIQQSGTRMDINQATQRAVIDWKSFDVGSSAHVHFEQPKGGATLNRVLDGNASQIYGRLTATGQVFLVNPSGVFFAPGSRVDVGSIVASTLNIDKHDFMQGRLRFAGGDDSEGAVVNRGSIRVAGGGAAAFIAARIENVGEIEAVRGQVLMGAGRRVTLDLGGPVKIEVEEGALNALIEQGGAIRADGGLIFLSAKAANEISQAVINHTGVSRASAVSSGESGEIYLLGDMQRGEVRVAGALEARSADKSGFVETSAAKVKVEDGASVRADHWLIDPNDFTVAASGGDMTGATLSASLASGNVTIESTSGATEGNGDIFVRDGVTWNSGNTLTLRAHRNIEILATVDASNGAGGKVVLEYGQGAPDGIIGGQEATYHFGLTTSGFTGKINLQPGQNFSTKLGSAGSTIDYTVITQLGNEGDEATGPDNSLQGLGHSSKSVGSYALGSDIDASATVGWNGGSGFSTIYLQNSIFEGLGHSIDGLSINKPTPDSNRGLLSMEATVARNVAITNANMTLPQTQSAGILAGLAGSYLGKESKIYNVYTSGNLSGNHYVGGIVGYALGVDIKSSISYANVSGEQQVGGAIGFGGVYPEIEDVHAFGNVSGNVSGVGTGYYIGGMVGRIYSVNGYIRNSSAHGAVSGVNYVGGLVGWSHVKTENSYATGNVTGTDNVGGLAGWGEDIINSYATGNILGVNDVGGLAGGGARIENSWATGDVTATGNKVGGIVGSLLVYLKGSTYSGNVSGANEVGGIAGSGGAIYWSRSLGSVSGNTDVGGIVGSGSVIGSYSAGSVSGVSNVGGIAGSFAWVYDSYSIASVSGMSNVGGAIGDGSGGVITNSFAAGSVIGSSGVGGLVGGLVAPSVTNSFYDTEATGQATSAGGIGITTAEMKQLSTFADAGWDIDDAGGTGKVWRIYEGDTYPLLRHFMTPLNIDSVTPAGSKVYDGTPVTSVPNGLFTISTPHDSSKIYIGGNVVGQKNAGAYSVRLYSVQDGYDLIGVRNSDYTITPKPVTATYSAASRVYDGTTNAVVSASTGDFISGDDVSVAATGQFADKNAGTGKTVIVTGSIDGADAANYQLTNPTDTATADIARRPVTVTADSKEKTEGAAEPVLTYTTGCGTLTSDCGLVSGEDLSGNLSRESGEDVGTYAITQGSITNENNPNYDIAYVGATFTINPLSGGSSDTGTGGDSGAGTGAGTGGDSGTGTGGDSGAGAGGDSGTGTGGDSGTGTGGDSGAGAGGDSGAGTGGDSGTGTGGDSGAGTGGDSGSGTGTGTGAVDSRANDVVDAVKGSIKNGIEITQNTVYEMNKVIYEHIDEKASQEIAQEGADAITGISGTPNFRQKITKITIVGSGVNIGKQDSGEKEE